MLYREPKVMAGSNLTGRQVSLSRAITWCPVPATAFIRSYCDPETWVLGTLQRYTVVCESSPIIWMDDQGNTATRPGHIVERSAHCEDDEICITTYRRTAEANCVKTIYFTRMMGTWSGVVSPSDLVGTTAEDDTQNALAFDLNDLSASMIVSDRNGSTPIEVDTFQAEAGVSGDVKSTQVKKCRDCLDLETEKFRPDTDFLKTDVRLLTTGAAVGIFWLAIMSG